MVERATLAGGELSIESAPGGGTTIYLQIPFREDTPKDNGAAYE
jgi:signal transduction histidine kinase